MTDGLSGVIKYHEDVRAAELHWFHEKKEYNVVLWNFSEDKEELRSELVNIANSI